MEQITFQELNQFARDAQPVRGYFITGEKDRTLDKVRELQNILKENNMPFIEELHPDLAHGFPLIL